MINYYLLTKPKILFGNLVTLVAGFLLASKGTFDFPLFFAAFMGLAFIMASGCVLNNYIDRNLDKKMERTKNRPLVTGLISNRNALLFAVMLELIGNLILWKYTNNLTVVVAGVGFFVYVFLYSLWKSRTIYGTAIGSIAGAIPPIVGYCAVSNRFDVGAAIFFMMMVLWQMPHFFAIAVYRLDDYTAANIPVLPVMRGMRRTKIQSVVYIAAFICTSVLLTYYNYTGTLYLITVLVTGLLWLALAIRGFTTQDDQEWGKQMFRFSLILIGAICIAIPYDVI